MQNSGSPDDRKARRDTGGSPTDAKKAPSQPERQESLCQQRCVHATHARKASHMHTPCTKHAAVVVDAEHASIPESHSPSFAGQRCKQGQHKTAC